MTLPQPSPDATALVTGASSGIGAAFARRLAARGYNLTLTARRADRLTGLADELRDRFGVQADPAPADLSEPASRERLADTVAERGRLVQLLVNNAGFGIYRRFVDSDRDRELRQVRVDVEAVVDLMTRYLPGMVDRGAGAVINLSSTAGLQPLPGNASYSAAKAYVLWLSEAVQYELRGTGVTVTAVCPGPVPTEFQQANDARFAERLPGLLWTSPERVADDALRAADAGRRTVIPGGLLARLGFAPGRLTPSAVSLPVSARLMRPPADG